MKFRNLRKKVLSEEIMAEIVSMIKSGEIQPGDKLPPEREMAATMNVSRPSLREALRTLAFMGIVEIIQGGGIYVTDLKPDLLVEHLDLIFVLEDYTYLQLLEARRIVEPGIAELAALRVTQEDIAELEALVEESVLGVDDKERFAEIDIELHKKISDIAQNPILNHLMASVDRLGQASRSRTTEVPHVRHRTVEDHRDIVQALAAGDSQAARQAMILHLTHVEEGLKHTPVPNAGRSSSPPLPLAASPDESS